MVAPDEIDLGKDRHAGQAGVKVLNVRERVAVVHRGIVEAAEVTTRPPGLRTICSGEAQGELERRMMPSCSILANSDLATASLSASRRRARAWSGGPSVRMWCSTPCLFVSVDLKRGTRSSGKSSMMRSKALTEGA